MAKNLRDYVVSLKFDVRAGSERLFKNSLENIGKTAQTASGAVDTVAGSVSKLGLAITAAVLVTDRMVKSLEAITLRTRLTGASRQELDALAVSFERFGLDASTGADNLAKQLRTLPGIAKAQLGAFGISLTDASGKVKSSVDLYAESIEALAKIEDPTQRYFRAHLLGLQDEVHKIDANREAILKLAPIRKQIAKDLQESAVRTGYNTEKIQEFSLVWASLGKLLAQIRDSVFVRLLDGEGGLKGLYDWFKKNDRAIVDGLVKGFQTLVTIIKEGVVPVFSAIFSALKGLHDLTGGVSTQIIVMTLLVAKLATGLRGLLSVLLLIGRTPIGLALTGLALGAGYLYDKFKGGESGAPGEGEAQYDAQGNVIGSAPTSNNRNNSNTPTAAPNNAIALTGTTADKRNAVIQGLEQRGFPKHQAIGIAANIERESNFNPGAIGDGGKAFGLAQWHPDRQAEFKKLYGKDMREASFNEQLDFLAHELRSGNEQSAGRRLAATTNAADAASVTSQYYLRPANRMGEANQRANLAQSIEGTRLGNVASNAGGQTVNINVYTDSNQPQQIAYAIQNTMQGIARHQVAVR